MKCTCCGEEIPENEIYLYMGRVQCPYCGTSNDIDYSAYMKELETVEKKRFGEVHKNILICGSLFYGFMMMIRYGPLYSFFSVFVCAAVFYFPLKFFLLIFKKFILKSIEDSYGRYEDKNEKITRPFRGPDPNRKQN